MKTINDALSVVPAEHDVSAIIRDIHERGLCCVPNVYSAGECKMYCDLLDKAIADLASSGGYFGSRKTQVIYNYFAHDERLYQLFAHDLINSVMTKLIDKDCVLISPSARNPRHGREPARRPRHLGRRLACQLPHLRSRHRRPVQAVVQLLRRDRARAVPPRECGDPLHSEISPRVPEAAGSQRRLSLQGDGSRCRLDCLLQFGTLAPHRRSNQEFALVYLQYVRAMVHEAVLSFQGEFQRRADRENAAGR